MYNSGPTQPYLDNSMQVKDLKPIIDEYNQKRGLFRWLKDTQGMARLKALYDPVRPEKDITEEIKVVLQQHWSAIKKTDRSYLNVNIKATELAFVRLAAFLDQLPSKSSGESKDIPKALGSQVRILTLMPPLKVGFKLRAFQSFTKYVDFNEPRINVRGRILSYKMWVQELKGEVKEISEANLVDYLNKKFDLKVPGDRSRFIDLKDALFQVKKVPENKKELGCIVDAVTKVASYAECTNFYNKLWNSYLSDIPTRYFFRTQDNIGFDIRMLFFTGFKNPVNGRDIDPEDMQKLLKHNYLGFSVYRFQEVNDLFSLREEKGAAEAKATTLLTNDWVNIGDLKLRQTIYDRFAGLLELASHLNHDFLKNVPEGSRPSNFDMATFKDLAERERVHILWSEMKDEEFFSQAAQVLSQLQTTMREWDNSTNNFFDAMRDFALRPDFVLANNLRIHGEYLVRVTGLDTNQGAKDGMKLLVDQFKTAFHIAYRYNKLEKLMGCMTPAGVCIAEKMKHLVSAFGSIESAGPSSAFIAGIDDLFLTIMQNARREEIRRGAVWTDNDFLHYIIRNHIGVSYVDANKVVRGLDEATIRNYMIDVLSLDVDRPNLYRVNG